MMKLVTSPSRVKEVVTSLVWLLLLGLAMSFFPAAEAQTTNYRSIGTFTGDLASAGTATIVSGSNVVNFSLALPGRVGVGDQLTIDPGGTDDIFYIVSVDSKFQVTVDRMATITHTNSTYKINRAYNVLQDWADPIGFGGRGGDLVSDLRTEIGIIYNDGPLTSGVVIDGNTTSANYRMILTVAQSDRHKGIAGTGAVLEGQDLPGNGIVIRDDFTEVEYLELAHHTGASGQAAVKVEMASSVVLESLLIHDFIDPSFDVVGIAGPGEFTARNCMIQDGDYAGIHLPAGSTGATVQNCTVYNMAEMGLFEEAGTLDVTNTISMDNATQDFVITNGVQSYNMSSDTSATGTGSLPSMVADQQFASIASGKLNLHLRWGADALDKGTDLSIYFTQDIDSHNRFGAWDIGADERQSVNFRSIGTNATELHNAGTATIMMGETKVTFSGGANLPGPGTTGAVGRGDLLDINGETFYILDWVSPTEVTVQSPAMNDHPGDAYSITRAFNTLASWEAARKGDLVTKNRLEVGVVYNDGPFSSGVTISGSVTDPDHYMKLTVAEGQRHNGTVATGAVVGTSMSPGNEIWIQDDHTIVEWLIVKSAQSGASDPAGIKVDARDVHLNNLILQDDDYGILVGDTGNSSFAARNCIIYNANPSGIAATQPSSTGDIQNCTIWASGGHGIDDGGSVFNIVNTISMQNGGNDFNISGGTHSNNMSGDSTAPGVNSLPGTPTSGQFVNIAFAPLDFHLVAGSDAIDNGADLRGKVVGDIDGQLRPGGPKWDIGADEFDAASATCAMQIEIGSYSGTGTAGVQILGLPFQPDVVIVKANQTSTDGVIRTATMSDSKDLWMAVPPEPNLITSLDPDGFTLGDDSRVNANGVEYVWTAFQACNDLKLGTYVGNGVVPTDTQSIAGLGFSPDYLIIVGQGSTTYVQHRTRFGGANSKRMRDGSAFPDTIPSLDPDGFTVQVGNSSTDEMNTSGETYHYIAFNEVPGKVKVGTYLGDALDNRDITGVGFQPDYVILQTHDGIEPAVQRSAAMAGADVSTDFQGPYEPDLIQAFLPDGFQIGADPRVNVSGQNYDYVAFLVYVPTAVELVQFKAKGLDGEVLLEWETGSEVDNLGFYLYRSSSPEGPWEQVNEVAVKGLGSSPVGGRYSYRDRGLVNGKRYYYEIEDFEASGKRERHGPVWAVPERGATEDKELGGAEGLDGAVGYGQPEANELKVLRRGEREVVLELTTRGFYAEAQSDGSVRLSVPGFSEEWKPGAPTIPVKRAWVEALAGKNVRVASVRAREVRTYWLRPSSAEAPAVVVSRRGVVRAGRRARRAGAAFRGAGLYPEQAARVVSVGFQGEEKKALVELSPLRWDRSRGRLLVAERLEVRLVFEGRVADEQSLGGSRGRRYRKRKRAEKDRVLTRMSARTSGLYGVRFEEVFGRRDRAMPTSRLRLSRLGEPVAYHVEPDGEWFGPGSVLYWFSEGEVLNPYGNEAVYELGLGGEAERMEPTPAPPSGPGASYYWHRVEKEENHFYGMSFETEPLWLWDTVLSGGQGRYGFEVKELVATAEPGALEIRLKAVSDGPGGASAPRVRLWMNRQFLSEATWSSRELYRLQVEVPPGVLREGDNELVLENASPSAYTAVMLDGFGVTYPRRPVAEGGVLRGRWSAVATAEVAAVGERVVVLDVTDREPRWLEDIETTPAAVRFGAEARRSYFVVSADAVLAATVQRAHPSRLKDKSNRADYLVVGPRELLTAAKPLLKLRRRQGLRTKAVAMEDIYEAFGYGETRPEALKAFLEYAYHEWRTPSLRYVVLLGDGTYDFKDYLGTGVVNQVPPHLEKTSFMWTASDGWYARVNGDDVLADLAIGRLPASTVEEARVMVVKLVSNESSGRGLSGPVILVADNPDEAGDFEADAEELASGVLASRDPQRIYLGRLGTEATRSAIVQAFDEGASLLSYVGHGSLTFWTHENVFDREAVARLAPQAQQPLVLTLNCLNGFFHFPYFDALAEELLKAETKGAVAAVSPSGLSLNGPAHRFHRALLEELDGKDHERLGDALLAAQERYAEAGEFLELLSIFHLFGDPAMTLK